jgi:hypothetical protein
LKIENNPPHCPVSSFHLPTGILASCEKEEIVKFQGKLCDGEETSRE